MTSQKPIALVTGASRGIGAAVAQRLAADGAAVFGTATTPSGAGAIEIALAPHGGHALVLNVCDTESIDAAVRQITGQAGPISILVNNAGITRDGLLLRMKDEDWTQVLDTDLSAVFRVCRAVVPAMLKARWGRIVNIGSVVGSMGNAGQVNYCAAKAGLVGLSKALAREIGSRGVTVNVVAPGFIDTDMTRALPETARTALVQQTAVRRFGTVEDIAAAVAFLVSPGAGYVTGETLHVNGGMYMI